MTKSACVTNATSCHFLTCLLPAASHHSRVHSENKNMFRLHVCATTTKTLLSLKTFAHLTASKMEFQPPNAASARLPSSTSWWWFSLQTFTLDQTSFPSTNWWGSWELSEKKPPPHPVSWLWCPCVKIQCLKVKISLSCLSEHYKHIVVGDAQKHILLFQDIIVTAELRVLPNVV